MKYYTVCGVHVLPVPLRMPTAYRSWMRSGEGRRRKGGGEENIGKMSLGGGGGCSND